jgi:hypothetical protein
MLGLYAFSGSLEKETLEVFVLEQLDHRLNVLCNASICNQEVINALGSSSLRAYAGP